VVRLAYRRGAALASMNHRVVAVRGLFGYAVQTGVRMDSPVPASRRSAGRRTSSVDTVSSSLLIPLRRKRYLLSSATSMFEPVNTFVVESPLPDATSVTSSFVWVQVALIVAGLLWVSWKTRKSTD
jgi:hypothetical protein